MAITSTRGRLTERTPARGTERHAYSHQKAAVERVLDEALTGSATDAYVFRPCVVAGPDAPALLNQLPYLRLAHMLPAVALRALGRVPALKPVLPDHGVGLQSVHHDDVAAALGAGVLERGHPGVYNLAGAGGGPMVRPRRRARLVRRPDPQACDRRVRERRRRGCRSSR